LKISPQPEIWGSHGLERLKPDGSYEIAAMDENALRGIVTADEWTQEVGLSDLCEKNQVHWHCTGAD
jgi:trehalose 6-phosphate phosphatase